MELDRSVRCFQTNHEGQLDRLVPRARSWADGIARQSRRLDALQLRDRDAAELLGCRWSRSTSPTSPSGRNGAGHSVIEDVVSHRVVGRGPDGYRDALCIVFLQFMSRIARLREQLPELGTDSLLVTNGTNVRYLTGFQSSRRRPSRRLPREASCLPTVVTWRPPRAIPDVEVVETTHEAPGDLAGHLRELATGRVGFEAAHVSVSRHARLAASRRGARRRSQAHESGLRAVEGCRGSWTRSAIGALETPAGVRAARHGAGRG